jgi:hypothetical protein
MSNISKEKVCILMLKYIPIISAIVMLFHVGLLMLGIRVCISQLTVLTLVTVMVIYWSYVLKFCLIHVCSSLYTILILWCCYIQAYIGFGIYLPIARFITFCLGVILLMGIIVKHAKHNKELIA